MLAQMAQTYADLRWRLISYELKRLEQNGHSHNYIHNNESAGSSEQHWWNDERTSLDPMLTCVDTDIDWALFPVEHRDDS